VTLGPRPLWLGAIWAGLALAATTPAAAQVAIQAEFQSDNRYRGVSLSEGRPAIGVTLSYDAPSGLYAGVTGASAIDRDALSYTAYVGYAHRIGETAWDVGLTGGGADVRPGGPYARRYEAVYAEVYAGLTRHNVSAHLYYSPRYIVEEAPTLYADIEGAVRPATGWRVFAHAGLLVPLASTRPGEGGERADVRLGVAREFRRGELDLAWTATTPAPVYPEFYHQRPQTLIAGARWFF